MPIEEKTFKEKSEKIVSKVIDTKYACCYDTLTTPIKETITTMKSDEILEIIVKPNLEREFNKYVEEEGYEILEDIREEDENMLTLEKKIILK